jgi:hypothetical protein
MTHNGGAWKPLRAIALGFSNGLIRLFAQAVKPKSGFKKWKRERESNPCMSPCRELALPLGDPAEIESPTNDPIQGTLVGLFPYLSTRWPQYTNYDMLLQAVSDSLNIFFDISCSGRFSSS